MTILFTIIAIFSSSYTVTTYALDTLNSLPKKELRSVKVFNARATVSPLKENELVPRCYQEIQSMPQIKARVEKAERIADRIAELSTSLQNLEPRDLNEKINNIKNLSTLLNNEKETIRNMFPKEFQVKDRKRIIEWSIQNPKALTTSAPSPTDLFTTKRIETIINPVTSIEGKDKLDPDGIKMPPTFKFSQFWTKNIDFAEPLNNPFSEVNFSEIKHGCQAISPGVSRPREISPEILGSPANISWSTDREKGMIYATEVLSMAESCILSLDSVLWVVIENKKINNRYEDQRCEYFTGPVLLHYQQGSERINYTRRYDTEELTRHAAEEREAKINPPIHTW